LEKAARPALPRTAEDLPPLSTDFWQVLNEGLASLGLRLTPGSLAAIDAQARLLAAWNASINLTALRTDELVARGHVLDSLAAVEVMRSLNRQSPSLIDLGSGAGYPGLPLAVVLPARRAALVDSIGKKAAFLEVAAQVAMQALRAAQEPVPEIAALKERAEDLADEADHRDSWDLVVARAVGSVAEVAELGLPLARVGGAVVAWKRETDDGALAREIDAARSVIRECGGGAPQIVPLPAAALLGLDRHCLVIVSKRRPTPAQFPRAAVDRRRASAGRQR
jgi:16S rRNA (guanine527-N7)-methyltransferase